MGVTCYFLNLNILSSYDSCTALLMNVIALILVVAVCNIIYMTIIFMLKVLTIDELKGYDI